MNCKSLKANYIILFILMIVFMLAYIFSPIIQVNEIIVEQNQEPFYQNNTNEFLPIDKIKIYQGNGIPNIDNIPIKYDFEDPSLPSVDGESPLKSMNIFAFNKCDVKCCMDSSYSCSGNGGGCVCMSPKQQRYLASRGNNNSDLYSEY